MNNPERENALRHNKNHSYTDKPLTLGSQSKGRSSQILGRGTHVNNSKAFRAQRVGLDVSSSNNNGGQTNWKNEISIKMSNGYKQTDDDRVPHTPVKSDPLKRNTSAETPSRIPTSSSSSRRTNISKSNRQETVSKKRMNGRLSQDFRFLRKDGDESEGSIGLGDGSPSRASRNSWGNGQLSRRYSLSTGAYVGTGTTQENIEKPSLKNKYQYDHRRKEKILANENPVVKVHGHSQKNSVIRKKPTDREVRRTIAQAETQTEPCTIISTTCPKAQNISEALGELYPKKFKREIIDLEDLKPELYNPWKLSISLSSKNHNFESTIPMSVQEKNNNDEAQKWEDTIDFTAENLTTSPLLKANNRLDVSHGLAANNMTKTQLEHGRDSNFGEIFLGKTSFPKRTSSSEPSTPARKLSPGLKNYTYNSINNRRNANLSYEINNFSNEELNTLYNENKLYEIPNQKKKETCEQITKRVERKPLSLVSQTESLLSTKEKKQPPSPTETKSFTGRGKQISKNIPVSPTKKSEQNFEYKTNSSIYSQPKPDVDHEERIVTESKLFESQPTETNSEFNSNSAMSPVESSFTNVGNNNEKSQNNEKKLVDQTPKVTGAYTETPAPCLSSGKRTQKGARRRAISLDEQGCIWKMKCDSHVPVLHTHSSSLSTHPQEWATKSPARTTIINTAQRITASEDIKRIKIEQNIEDSDTDSLLDKAANLDVDVDLNELIIKMSGDRALDIEHDWARLNLSPSEKERFIVSPMMERMIRKLNSTSHGIQDTKQGIERLQQQFSTSLLHNSAACKQNCEQIATKSSWLYIRVPPPRPGKSAGLFRNRNWKFTWLGLTLYVVFIWYIAEFAMCEVFCHPEYSNKNTWQPSDPFFPWAIPTKLDQWSGRIISEAIEGFLDWFDPNRHTRQQWPKQTYSGHDWWGGRPGPAPLNVPMSDFGEAGSINDDEIWK